MSRPELERVFAGAIPGLYQQYMVPMLFEPCAGDLAERVIACRPARVLELAAGTGVLTRRLSAQLPAATHIVATDLNQAMLDQAAKLGSLRPVSWKQADAMQVPEPDGSFDVVVCQFGVMFFPDKAAAYAEAGRLLRPGGRFIFNVWDRLEENEFTLVAHDALASCFPDDPPRFMARVPHGYHAQDTIARDLTLGGFTRAAQFTTLALRSRAESAQTAAMAFCQGTPLRNEIVARDPTRLEEVTLTVAAALARRFGAGELDGKIQAHVVTVAR